MAVAGVSESSTPATARFSRFEPWLVGAVVLHSVAVAAMLLFLPAWSARFGGWGTAQPLFFARQAGIFHLVVALGYAREYLRHRDVSLLVGTKGIAVLFLVGVWLAGETAWAVPLSALGDGAMGLAVWWVHHVVGDGRARG